MADTGAWAAAVPAVLVAVLWCTLPGLLVTLAAGLRGVLAWSLAPALTVPTIAVGAVAASAAGVPWSGATAAGPALVLAALTVGARWLLARRRREPVPEAPAPEVSVPETPVPGAPVPHEGRAAWIAAAAGVVGAALVGAVAVVNGMGLPDAVSQTYDAVFHYSAVARILADGDASSLTLGTLTDPGAQAAFYPAAWHGLVSLVVVSAGAGVPLASNATAAVVAVVVWPLGCLALVRVLAGPSWPALAAAPVLAVGFISYPWSLLSFGVLWPNLVGVSLVPAALAALVAAVGPRADASLTRLRAGLLLPVVVVGLGLAHPSAVFSLAVLGVFPAAGALARVLVRTGRTGRRGAVVAVLGGLVAVAAVAGAVQVLLTAAVFDDIRSFDWPAFQTPLEAVRQVALDATNDGSPAWVVSVLVLVGALASWRAGYRWLVPAHLAAGTLYVVAASTESPLTAAVTAFWYNDAFRLAAMLPVTGVPLAVLGLLVVGSLVHRLVPRVGAGTVTAAATAVVVVATGGLYAAAHASFVDESYLAVPPDRTELLDPAERAFFDEVAAIVPPGAVVAQNPWTGSALLWPLTGTEVLFPHLVGEWTADQRLLSQRLDDPTVPGVCAAAARTRVGWLLVGERDFWPEDGRSRGFPGLEPDGRATGLRRVAEDGSGNALYRLTGCGGVTAALSTGPGGS